MDSFFGIGLFELVLIAIIALVVMGPERLPGAMREAAKYMRQLRQVSNEFQSQFSEELQLLDELNPKRILNDTINPPAPRQPLKQPTSKPAAQTGRAALLAPAGAEPGNSILPPKPASTTAPAETPQDGGAAPATVVTAPAVQADPVQPASQVDNPPSAAEPAPAEDGQ